MRINKVATCVRNRGVSEEEFYQDVERAVTELRQEEYERKHNENQTS